MTNLAKSKNITKEVGLVSRQDQEKQTGHQGQVLWFTGLSGSGKSTIAKNLEKILFDKGKRVYVLDGDNVRNGLCKDLGFSHEDRSENLRRIAEVAKLFTDAGFITIVAFISPYEKDRLAARNIVKNNFHEIYVKASIDICKERDPKGLYEKAIKGEIKNFTGISDVYEEPKSADLILDTDEYDIDECLKSILNSLIY